LARELGLRQANETSLSTALQRSSQQSIRTIWLIDESADVVPSEAQQLASRCEALSVLMAVSDNSASRIDCEHRIALRTLSLKETQAFLQQTLGAGDRKRQPLSAKEIEQIHQRSGGRIKTICRLAEQQWSAIAAEEFARQAA
jgi:hypothetical protein